MDASYKDHSLWTKLRWAHCVFNCISWLVKIDYYGSPRRLSLWVDGLMLGESQEVILSARQFQFCQKLSMPIAPIAALPREPFVYLVSTFLDLGMLIVAITWFCSHARRAAKKKMTKTWELSLHEWTQGGCGMCWYSNMYAPSLKAGFVINEDEQFWMSGVLISSGVLWMDNLVFHLHWGSSPPMPTLNPPDII